MDPFQDTPPADDGASASPNNEFSGFEDDAVVVGDEAPAATDEALPNGVESNGMETNGEDGLPASVSDEVSAVNAAMEDMNVSEPTFSPPRPQEEPETMRVWGEEQTKRLQEKDEKETKMMEELREQAKKELSDWYKKYEDQLGKTKEDNRQEEKTFVAEMNEITPGTEWERVHKLCDFNQKNSKNNKDISRLRTVLLQLKQNPKEVQAN